MSRFQSTLAAVIAGAVLAVSAPATGALAQDRPSAPAGAEVYIISPKNGESVHGPVIVRFGLKGMGVAPAGVQFDNTGHHHLLVDTDLADLNLGAPLPANDKVIHFGKGQTETTLTLAPGSTRSSSCSPITDTCRLIRRFTRRRSPSP